ncbi:MAG TPA: hypothetical protein VFR67_28215 [Pilimelia sp.]|nr:hypothetical protein [Pilimelia sp.]
MVPVVVVVVFTSVGAHRGLIGVKLVLEALHDNNLPFINGGYPIEAIPSIPSWPSLTVIGATMAVTTVWSVLRSRRDARLAAARYRHAYRKPGP